MKQMMLQGGGGQYKGGFGGLTKVMAREFEKLGGTLLRNCRVDKITVADGFVTGVETERGRFDCCPGRGELCRHSSPRSSS